MLSGEVVCLVLSQNGLLVGVIGGSAVTSNKCLAIASLDGGDVIASFRREDGLGHFNKFAFGHI